MSKVSINYTGGIDDKEKGTNLTGSQTIFSLDIGKTRNPRIVIDSGAIQGVKKARELNKQIPREVLGADALVITHAHSDHAGMVPYIYKKGFSGKIIMTELTKLQCKEMWLDYVRLTRNEIEEVTQINSKIAKKLKDGLVIKKLYEDIIQPDEYLNILRKKIDEIKARNKEIKNYYTKYFKIKTAYETLLNLQAKEKTKLSKEEKDRLKEDKKRVLTSLEKIIKKNDLENAYNEALVILKDKKISSSDDINSLLEEVPKIEKNTKNKNAAISQVFEITGNTNYEMAYGESMAILKEYGVETEQDISSVLREIPELLFDEDDIELVYNKIETLELGEELELQNYHPISSGTDKIIDELPKMVKNGFNKQIPVLNHLKGTVTSKLLGLIKKISKEVEENNQIQKENEELSQSLKLALNFVGHIKESGINITTFEEEYGELLKEDISKLFEKIESLTKIDFKGDKYDINELIKIYHSFKFPLSVAKDDHDKLEEELKELGINTNEIKKAIQNFNIETENDYINRVKKTGYEVIQAKQEKKGNITIKEINSIFTRNNIKIPKNIDDSRDEDEIIKNIIDICNGIVKLDKHNKLSLISLKDLFEKLNFNLSKNSDRYNETLNEKISQVLRKYEKELGNHLGELPDRDYENKDIKAALKEALITSDSNINISDYVVIINEINQFSPGEILSFLKSEKRVYCNSEISTKLLDKVIEYVQKNNDNIKRNNDLRDALSRAYDLVQIYEGNKQLYLENNKKEYLKRLKFVTNYKKTPIQETKYDIDELDYIIDLDYTSIAKNKTIIHIRRLDDSRIYDILLTSNFDTVYYFEPKIRDRIKEKLSEYIKRIDNEKRLEVERFKMYLDNVEFVRIYEGKQKLEISESEYKQAKELLKKHSISSKSDINNFNFFNVDYPYTLKDVENYFRDLIITSNEFSLNSIDVINITSIDDERIYDLPYIYEDKNKFVILDESIKEQIRKKLLLGMGDFFKTSTIRKKKRIELLEKLRLFQEYSKNYEYLFDINGFNLPQDFLNNLLLRSSEIRSIFEKINKIKLALDLKQKLTEGDSQREADYIEAKDLLEKYNVKNENDISKVLKVPHFIPYSIDDVKKAISLLKSVHIDKNQDILESIKLNFFDAGHIEGSVQAVLTMVVSEVDNVLKGSKRTDIKAAQKRKLKHINYGFSGDLGRIKDPNLAGTPKAISFKLDYYQMEATYAERVHLDKKISIKRLFSSIESAGGKILIPAFSMQRTQEVLMILLQKRLDSQDDINKIKELVKEKRKKETELSGFSKNLSDKDKLKEKEAIEDEIKGLELNINYFKSKVFDIDIILDSPLSEKITEIYIEKCGKKYNLLDKKVQKELFGREIISYVKKTGKDISEEENDGRLNIGDLYTPERRNKKEIIMSASGMCDGGAILPHLKENLSNPNSKIIAVGYAPENTRLGKIKLLDEFISITGEIFELKCEVDDIPGFSGHIDEEEMIILLTQMEFKKGATLVLTHGDEKRFALAGKIQAAMDEVGKKIKIVVPKLGDTTNIKI